MIEETAEKILSLREDHGGNLRINIILRSQEDTKF